MELIRDNIEAFLAESGINYEEDPPGSGNFSIHDYRPDGTPFITAASTSRGWVNFGSGVAPAIQGRSAAVASFTREVMRYNEDRPLAKYCLTSSDGLALEANYPAHAHSERLFSDHLVDIRNAQCEEVPRLLDMGQRLGIDFGFRR